MNIIIPIGGVGKRFSDQGYVQPKPLIRALGRPIIFWVLDSLKKTVSDRLYIVYRSDLDQHGFVSTVQAEYPTEEITFLALDNNTEGAADTVKHILLAKEMEEFLHLPTLIVDSDSYSETNIVSLCKKYKGENVIFFSLDTNPDAKFSYICTDENNRVTKIKEKVKISDQICIGSYCFSSADFLLGTILEMEEKKITLEYAREFYFSSVYSYILEENSFPIYAHFVNNFNCLGTPVQLQDFCNLHSPRLVKMKGLVYRFCFDLDNTLVTRPQILGNYCTVKPIEQNIQFLRKLYEQGHTIIIYTARHMKTQQGNVGITVAKIGQTVFKNLEDFSIPYHELYFGKPYAHFYIDDLAINATENLEKSLGFYNLYPPLRNHHQSIEFLETKVIKRSENIKGEIWWYSNIPTEITMFFPKLYKALNNELHIERIHGIPLSYMLVNKTLTKEHLHTVIHSLHQIHSSCANEQQQPINLHNLYSGKFVKRVKGYNFSSCLDFNWVYETILAELQLYEKKMNQREQEVMHGDPVLTNILFDLHGNCKFIDMRGGTEEILTILGDIYYDWAKLYQSLCGYEFILLGRQIDEKYLFSLRKEFCSFFTIDEIKDITFITASLFISLIPLHSYSLNETMEKYYSIAHCLIKTLIKRCF